MDVTWFLFDLGNTVIKIAYERVMEKICKRSALTRDELVELLEQPGAYRDMERGAVSFAQFYDFLSDKAAYRGSLRDLQEIWSDFFDGPMPGIESLLDRLRQRYRLAFLSNSNEVHAELIPRRFATLFQKDDRFIFSHRFGCAKPDPEIFRHSLEVMGVLPHQVAFVDDLLENVLAARTVGMIAFQFNDVFSLERQLATAGLL
jgi:putative hydrolase of the HAD superfamily